jgi:cyclic-di-GMP-binding protein
MALALSLPQIDERPSNPPETRLARVAPWLDDLLRGDATEAARVIGDALAATNRVSLSESRRLELSEKYYTTAQTLWPNLERQFSRAPHPLSGKSLEAAKASLTLSAELSTSYKHLLAHEAGKRILLTGNRLLIALIHRCLQCTARVLINSYLSYSPVPARTWHDAHLIYKFAFDRGLHQTPVASDNPDATPERLYMQALLLALANPYGFLPGQLAQVVQYLQEHSHWAKITDVAPVHRLAKAVAIVPLGHDFPPFSANKGGNIDGSKMFLLTFDLAFQIQEQLRGLDTGGGAPANISKDAASVLQYTALLRRLLRQWAIPPARQFNRLPSRARVVMCAGLAAVWQYSRGTHGNVANPPTGLPPMHACQVINHTPAGYALRQIDSAHAPLRIGDLIALRVEGRNTLQVAQVRWFRNTLRGSGLEFGCELLTDSPEAAAAQAEGTGSTSFQPVVLLPDEGQDGSPPMALAPAGAFQVEQAIALRRGPALSTVVLTKLVDQGPGFELFEYIAVA